MKAVCPIWSGRCLYLGSRVVDCPYHPVCPVARQRQALSWRRTRRAFQKRAAIRSASSQARFSAQLSFK